MHFPWVRKPSLRNLGETFLDLSNFSNPWDPVTRQSRRFPSARFDPMPTVRACTCREVWVHSFGIFWRSWCLLVIQVHLQSVSVISMTQGLVIWGSYRKCIAALQTHWECWWHRRHRTGSVDKRVFSGGNDIALIFINKLGKWRWIGWYHCASCGNLRRSSTTDWEHVQRGFDKGVLIGDSQNHQNYPLVI